MSLFGPPNTTALDVAFGPPLSSVAVTAIVVEPRSSPVRISRVPVADTVATTVSVDVAVSVCTSRASASVTSTCTVDVAPVGTVQSAIAATAGGLFGTVAVFRQLRSSPHPSTPRLPPTLNDTERHCTVK